MIGSLYTLALLVFAHALADFALQSDFMVRAKDRNNPLGANGMWMHVLGAHAVIHGGFVLLITQDIRLGLAEVIVHAVTDFLKCEKRINLHADQAIHIGCKVVWVLLMGVLP
jgi:Protein of unknown function (DUF3307)